MEELETQAGENEIEPGESSQEESPPDEGEHQDTENIEGIQISFGDEKPKEEEEDQPAPQWVKDLRKRHTDLKRQNRELRERLESLEKPQTDTGLPPEPGQLPTLEDCEYDETRFKQEVDAWLDRKNKREKALASAQAAQVEADKKWQVRLQNYNEKKTKLNLSDFEEVESEIKELLNVTQQGIIIHGADNPALVVYALGKNPAKARELSQIDDPIKFAFAAAKLENLMKVSKKKKPATAPEKTIKSTGAVSGTVDSQLARLRIEAEKTGDYSKVNAYNRQKRLSRK